MNPNIKDKPTIVSPHIFTESVNSNNVGFATILSANEEKIHLESSKYAAELQ